MVLPELEEEGLMGMKKSTIPSRVQGLTLLYCGLGLSSCEKFEVSHKATGALNGSKLEDYQTMHPELMPSYTLE